MAGFEGFGEVGAPCRLELVARDAEGAKAFYQGVFDWKAEEGDMGEGYMGEGACTQWHAAGQQAPFGGLPDASHRVRLTQTPPGPS